MKKGASKIFTIGNQILIYTVSHRVAVLQRKMNIVIVALILLNFQLKMKKRLSLVGAMASSSKRSSKVTGSSLTK